LCQSLRISGQLPAHIVNGGGDTEAVLAIRQGRPWPTQTRSWPTQTARVMIIPMIPTYTTSVGLPKICLAFDWPTQMKIPRTASGEIAFENGRISNFEESVTLTLTLDRVILHTVVHHSSTST